MINKEEEKKLLQGRRMIVEEAYLGPSSMGQALEVLACAKLILVYIYIYVRKKGKKKNKCCQYLLTGGGVDFECGSNSPTTWRNLDSTFFGPEVDEAIGA
jgi:hypothetical protein